MQPNILAYGQMSSVLVLGCQTAACASSLGFFWKLVSVTLHVTSSACMQRLGSKGVLGDFARSLCNLLAPNLVAPVHVVGLMKLAGSQEEAAAPVAQDLLLLLAPADPGLAAASADQARARQLAAAKSPLSLPASFAILLLILRPLVRITGLWMSFLNRFMGLCTGVGWPARPSIDEALSTVPACPRAAVARGLGCDCVMLMDEPGPCGGGGMPLMHSTMWYPAGMCSNVSIYHYSMSLAY